MTDVRNVSIPAGITDREQLFEAFAAQLDFPDYFGRNWDALYDCLTDLDWLPADVRHVVIAHAAVPGLPAEQLAIYRSLLADVVQDWKGLADDRRFEVAWPDAV